MHIFIVMQSRKRNWNCFTSAPIHILQNVRGVFVRISSRTIYTYVYIFISYSHYIIYISIKLRKRVYRKYAITALSIWQRAHTYGIFIASGEWHDNTWEFLFYYARSVIIAIQIISTNLETTSMSLVSNTCNVVSPRELEWHVLVLTGIFLTPLLPFC